MSQPSPSVPPSATADSTLPLGEPYEAIAGSDLALDEDAWRALLIQIDQAEDSG